MVFLAVKMMPDFKNNVTRLDYYIFKRRDTAEDFVLSQAQNKRMQFFYNKARQLYQIYDYDSRGRMMCMWQIFAKQLLG